MDEELKKKLAEIASGNKKQLDEIRGLVEAKAESSVIDAKLQDLQDSVTSLEFKDADGKVTGIKEYVEGQQKEIDEMALELKAIETKRGEEPETMEKQVKELVENKDFINALKKNQKLEFNIDLKSDMARSSFTADTGTTRLLQLQIPGVTKEPWQEAPLFASIQKQAVGDKVDSIRYVETNVRNNESVAVAEAAALTQSDVSTVARKEDFYKVGHYMTTSEESLEDSDFMQGLINEELRMGLLRTLETYHFVDNGSTPGTDIFYNMIGATGQMAKDFALPWNFAGGVANPNIWNLLSVMKLQVANGINTAGTSQFKGYNADVAFVNYGTLTEMKTLKDEDGRLLWRDYMTSDNQYDGMVIIPSWDIPANACLVGSSQTAKAYIKRQLTIKTSENVASQFLKDQVSIKATIREGFLMKILERYGWVYCDDIANGESIIAGS